MTNIPALTKVRPVRCMTGRWTGSAGISGACLPIAFSGRSQAWSCCFSCFSSPVDSAYVMNRITGQVWMVKTYSKQVGQVRVLAARVAEVEKTKDLAEDTANAAVAMNDQVDRTTTDRFDRGAL